MAKLAPPLERQLIRTSLRDQAYATLKEALLAGKFAPGARLVEREIAAQLGLSRSPVREAFRKLEQEGFLSVGRIGVTVPEISSADIHDLFDLRQRLEGMAGALAAQRASAQDIARLNQNLTHMADALKNKNPKRAIKAGGEFHALLYSLSGNKYLIATLSLLAEQIHRFRSLNIETPQRGADALQEHTQIVEAIARRDTLAADQLAQDHVRSSWHHTQQYLAGALHSPP